MAITPNACQQKAVDAFIKLLMNTNQKELIICGYPGTGKTSLTGYLVDNLPKFIKSAGSLGKKIPDYKVCVTATTRQASAEVAARLGTEPRTIHSLLGLLLKNNYSTGETYLALSPNAEIIHNTILFIDEGSYIDDNLKEKIRDRVGDTCKIIYTGDKWQLLMPNVMTAAIFDDPDISQVEMTTVERHSGAIAGAAADYRNAIITGNFPAIPTSGKEVMHVDGPTFQQLINHTFTTDFVPNKSGKIIAWSNLKVQAYNDYIGQARGLTKLVQAGETLITNKPIMGANRVLASGDTLVKISRTTPTTEKGIQGAMVEIANSVEIFVPDNMGEATALMKAYAKKKDWSKYFHIKDNWGDLRPSFSSTVYKAQGSTFDRVFIDLTNIGCCPEPSTFARMMNVAISRAAKQVFLYGDLPKKYLGSTHAHINDYLPEKLSA